jgi:hypothetical protein
MICLIVVCMSIAVSSCSLLVRHFCVTPSAHSSHEGPVDAFPPFVARFASLKDSNWHVEGGESRQLLGVVN